VIVVFNLDLRLRSMSNFTANARRCMNAARNNAFQQLVNRKLNRRHYYCN